MQIAIHINVNLKSKKMAEQIETEISQKLQVIYNRTYQKLALIQEEYQNIMRRIQKLTRLTNTIENNFREEYNQMLDEEEAISDEDEQQDITSEEEVQQTNKVQQ